MNPVIETSVTVSQELRDLVAARMALMSSDVEREYASPDISAEAPVSSAPSQPVWEMTRVRRDGDRPLIFTGLPVLSFDAPLQVGSMDCQHRMVVYIGRGQEMYLALSLSVPEDAAFRPLHQCTEIHPEDGSHLLQDWIEQVGDRAACTNTDGETTADLPDLPRRFHALTAHSFRQEQAPVERIETCLQ